ncbi:MAG: ribosome small subunit-dependent GTPase A [Bacteroidetes bacterium]|nr:ribosome small subunit-dependent GTPase A [Bacteroidota bacterium]
MKGIVIKSTGSWYFVQNENGQKIDCKLKGNFRIKNIRTTNPVSVGDIVEYTVLENEDKDIGLIHKIHERKNYIIRKATNLSKQSHIIAANIDQALLMATIASPRTSLGFMDRFLVTAEAYQIPVKIIFNKIDIYDKKNKADLKKIIDVYTSVGYECYSISALKKNNIDVIKELMKDKISLISGHSGVGKSAMINVIEPNLDLKTGEISSVHLKGKHTTTFAEMHPLSFGGYIIDTPGIKEFGVLEFQKEQVSHYFPEMLKILNGCQFNNCTHTHEPNCAVKDAVATDEISESRYINYLNILNNVEMDEKEWE